MKIVIEIAKLLSGIITILSGLVTLVCNEWVIGMLSGLGLPEKILLFAVLLIVGAFLIVSSILGFIHYLKSERTIHRLKFHSPKFFKFFSKWYSSKGELRIICEDIDWITDSDCKNNQILNTLLEKSRRGELKLFINKGRCTQPRNSKIIELLKEAGAEIKYVSPKLTHRYTFSFVSIMNNPSKIIVRDKQKDESECVVFEEIKNTYITEILNTIIVIGSQNE